MALSFSEFLVKSLTGWLFTLSKSYNLRVAKLLVSASTLMVKVQFCPPCWQQWNSGGAAPGKRSIDSHFVTIRFSSFSDINTYQSVVCL